MELRGRLPSQLGVLLAGLLTMTVLLHLGEQALGTAPGAGLDETVRLCITLLLFSGATLFLTKWTVDRALKPLDELENTRDELAASRAAERQLVRRLSEVQEDERRSLARDLHDEMGQTLTAIGVTAAYLERHAGQLDAGQISECARDLRRDVKASGEQLRALLRRLRPHGLDDAALAGALGELLASWQQREAGIDFRLAMPEVLPKLDAAAGLALYRVAQEALTNVVRHSGARHCRVGIEMTGEVLRLSVRDDGKGLPAAGPARRSGLLGMEERLAAVGGSLQTEGGAGGLHVLASLPLTRKEQLEEQS